MPARCPPHAGGEPPRARGGALARRASEVPKPDSADARASAGQREAAAPSSTASAGIGGASRERPPHRPST
eukprot:13910309-Alexandrium_andersonii.AAC.1